MKVGKIFVFILIIMFLLVACRPDLVVKNLDVTWNAANKKAEAEIANIGNKDAGSFMVYFNGEEDPVSPRHRPQVSHNVPSLAKGDSITLDADFAPLAHPDNNNLGNVYKILVLADAKNTVKESNEDNNEKEVLISPSVLLAPGKPFDVALDGSYVYWSELLGEFCEPPGALKRFPITGGAVQTLYSSCDFSPANIAVDSQWVYAVDWKSDNIVKIPITGGSPVTVAAANGAIYHRGISVDNTFVYWADDDGIKQATKDGASTVTLFSDPRVHDLAIDVDYVYWTGGMIGSGEIRRIDKSGGTVQTLASSGLHYPRSLVVDESYVYWAEVTTLKRVSIAGGVPPTTIYSEAGSQMSSVAVSGSFLYWSQTDSGGSIGSGKVRRIPKAGGSMTDIETSLSGPGSINLDNQSVYWGDTDGVKRADLPII